LRTADQGGTDRQHLPFAPQQQAGLFATQIGETREIVEDAGLQPAAMHRTGARRADGGDVLQHR